MTSDLDEVLDGLFHACAFAAFLEQAHARQDWPESELSHTDYDTREQLVFGAGGAYRRSNGPAQPGTVVPATAYPSSRRKDMSSTERSPSSPPHRRL